MHSQSASLLTAFLSALHRSLLGWLCALPLLVAGASAHADEALSLSATVPIFSGRVAAARSEAIKLIFLEAGQTGEVDIATRSVLVGQALKETVRVSSHFRLQSFRITQETIEGERLTVTAELKLNKVRPSAACQPILASPQFQWSWASLAPFDPEIETLIRLATRQAFVQSMPEALVITPTEAAPTLPYQLKLSLLSRGVDSQPSALRMTLMGPSTTPLLQAELVFGKGSLTESTRETQGLASFRQTHLSRETQQAIREFAQDQAAQLACLPAVFRIPNTRQLTLPLREALSSRTPLVFFSEQWPVLPDGEVDLLKLDGLLTPLTAAQPKEMTLDLLNTDEGPSTPRPGGYLLLQ